MRTNLRSGSIALLIILLTVIGTGCGAIKAPARTDVISVHRGISLLDGVYYNSPSYTSEKGLSVWGMLTYSRKKGFDSLHRDATVNIHAINNRRIEVQLIDTGIITSRVLKGTIRGDYFYLKRKIHYVGFPFIYVNEQDYQVRLGINRKQELLIDGIDSHFGWLVFFAAGYDDQFNARFDRKK